MINKLYKIKNSSIIIEVVNKVNSDDNSKCCEHGVEEMKENAIPAVEAKHLPVIEKTETGIKVKLGKDEHPMIPEHYIQWIEVSSDNYVYRKYLTSNDKPEACFDIKDDKFVVRAYCNIHGLWKLEVK